MAKFKYSDLIEEVWSNADECDCGDKSCHPNNHRLCGICRETILYGCHESVDGHSNSIYAWNIDHIIPESKGGTDELENLQAVHISCNEEKADKYDGHIFSTHLVYK